MKDSGKTLVFAGILAVVCSVLLAAVNLYTAPFKEANEKAEEIRNILSVLQVPFEPKSDARTLVEVFQKNVREKKIGDRTIYENISNTSTPGKPSMVAVIFSGPGLWGLIRGVISFEPDFTTIRGISFYQQEETPGLGGEIGSEGFQKQFEGKQIVSDEGKPGFRVIKPGGASSKNSVDGITGASMTSGRVQTILDSLAKELWQKRSEYGQ